MPPGVRPIRKGSSPVSRVGSALRQAGLAPMYAEKRAVEVSANAAGQAARVAGRGLSAIGRAAVRASRGDGVKPIRPKRRPPAPRSYSHVTPKNRSSVPGNRVSSNTEDATNSKGKSMAMRRAMVGQYGRRSPGFSGYARRASITEDSPNWNPATMGNKRYGPGARFPNGYVTKRGNGPGPMGSWTTPPASQGRRRGKITAG